MVLYFNGVSSLVTSPKDNICNILGHFFKQIVLNIMVENHSADYCNNFLVFFNHGASVAVSVESGDVTR